MLVNRNKFLYFVIVLISVLYSANSQNKLYIKDTVITRGPEYMVTVYNELNAKDGDNIEIVFSFNSRIIDITKIIPGFGWLPLSNPIDTNLSNLDSATIKLTANNVKILSPDNRIFNSFMIQGLAYSDSITYLTPRSLTINGVLDTQAQLVGGKITVRGSSIIPNFPDNLGNGYPSPFAGSINFNFSVEKHTNLDFIIFTTDGRQAASIDEDNDMFQIFDSQGNKIDNLSKSFEKGNYKLIFTPNPSNIASGLYFLMMKTDRGLHNANFIYAK